MSVAVLRREDGQPVKHCSRIVQALVVASFLGAVPARSGSLDTELGAKVAAQVEAQMGLVEQGRAPEYVEKIGQRLVSNLEARAFDYH